MGAELFEAFPTYKKKAERVLGDSIVDLCIKGTQERLNQTQYTQPALYVVSVLAYLKKLKETGKKPDFVAGHSLGEYAALFAAGAFDFQTGLRLVQKRGELMGEASGGAMAAVIGLPAEKIGSILSANGLTDVITMANYNEPLQTVISGPFDRIHDKQVQVLFQSAGWRVHYIPLKVSGAFHSPHMMSARNVFATFLKDIEFSPLQIPVISNVDAQPYRDTAIAEGLAQQLTCPVHWTATIDYLVEQEVTVFEEIGPGKVLTGLVQKILKNSPKDLSLQVSDATVSLVPQP